jgi:hypothetical protein
MTVGGEAPQGPKYEGSPDGIREKRKIFTRKI